MGSGRMSQAWTADAATRTFLMTASWTLFFLVVASLEFVVAASQTRMSAVLYVDGVSLMLLAVAYVVELGATWPLLRHARSGGGVVASVRARTAKPVRDVESRGAQATAPASAPVTAPLRTNVAVPALVRHALGRVAVVVMTPVVLLMWASEVSEPSSNYSIDGFVISIVLVHMGALVWEFLVTPTCAVVGACRLQKAYAAGAARKLQCVSFNVTRWQGEGEAIDLGRVVAALQLDAPDVVALQDVPRALDGRQGVRRCRRARAQPYAAWTGALWCSRLLVGLRVVFVRGWPGVHYLTACHVLAWASGGCLDANGGGAAHDRMLRQHKQRWH